MDTAKNALLIFTKNPVIGKVKTRIAKEIGDEMALKVYTQLLKHTREITEENDFCENKIFYDEFIPAKDGWKEESYDKYIQDPGDLSTKLRNAFQLMFDEGYERVIIFSPDCPELTGLRIKQAFTLLQTKDFVIGPLQDGGYYLLGMSKPHLEVIDGVEFGKGTAYAETLKNIETLGASVKELAITYDVDYSKDIPVKLRKLIGLEELVADLDDEELEEMEIKDEEGLTVDEEDSGYGDEPDNEADDEEE